MLKDNDVVRICYYVEQLEKEELGFHKQVNIQRVKQILVSFYKFSPFLFIYVYHF